MGIIFFKKEKFDKKFIEQTIDTVVLRKNIEVYETLKNKGETVGDKQLDGLRTKLAKTTDKGLKNAQSTVNQYSKAVGIYEAIKRFQTARRHKVLDVVRKHVELVEGKEVQRFIERFGKDINIPLFDKIVKNDFSMYDEVFGLDLFSLENLIEEEEPAQAVEDQGAQETAEEEKQPEEPAQEEKTEEESAEEQSQNHEETEESQEIEEEPEECDEDVE